MLLSSVFCLLTVLTFFLIASKKKTLITRVVICLFSFLPILYLSAHYVVNKFTGDGINEVVYFYIFKKGFPWGSISNYYGFISFVVVINIVIIALLIYLTKTKTKSTIKTYFLLLFITSSLISCYTNPSSKHLVKFFNFNEVFESQAQKDKLRSDFLDNFIINNNIETPKIKKNLIYIYLESFDSAFVNKPIFSSSTPNMRKLMDTGLLLTNVTMTSGAYYTIAGMSSSQCSLPEELAEQTNHNPVICMGDILKSIGYTNIYYSGADKHFSDKDKFYGKHGFDEIQDRNSLSKSNNITDMSSWGLYDQDLLSILANRLLNKETQPKTPFSVFMITLDTHIPIDYSKICLPLNNDKSRHNWFGAISCSDYLVTNFIRKIQRSPLWDNTYIVLSSDHLPPATGEISDIVNAVPHRKLFFLILGKDIKAGRINKQMTTSDIGATVLDKMQITDEIGLGRSALSSKSIANSSDEFNELIGDKWRNTIVNYIGDNSAHRVIQTEGELVYYLDKPYHLPFALNIYANNINKIESATTPEQFIIPDETSSAFVWINKCEYMKNLGYTYRDKYKIKYCVAAGAYGSKNIKIVPLTKSAFTDDDLRKLLLGYRDKAIAEQQKSAIKKLTH